jgi:DNA polymerase bacteriophage-type
MPVLFHDFETKSTLDLSNVGAWRYATDTSTDVWCCAFAVDDAPVQLWIPGNPVPPEFSETASNPEWTTSAFGDHFERLITQHIMVPRYSWPLIPIERHRCSQAAALALSLPAKLASVALVLELEHQKDESGRRVMLKLARGGEPKPGDLEKLHAYCRNDVAVERDLHHRIEGLIPEEQALWQLDATINDRGMPLDGKLLDAAINIAEAAQLAINTELREITGGELETIGQVGKLIEWLASRNCVVTDVQKTTLKRALTRKNLAPEVRRVMELRLDGAHAAAAKLETMRAWCNDDSRARGCFRYHGAATGRWTSFGIQVQNLKRPLIEDMGAAIEAVGTGNLEHLRQHYPQPMSVVGDIARAMICAAPGHRLIAADFSGIESRITAWISGQQSKIDQWAKFDRTGDPKDEPYYILGKQVSQPDETARTIGKTADLAFGYMGGPGAWKKLAPNDDTSTEAEIRQRQQAWRRAHPQTVKFWGTINRAAIQAVRKPNTIIACGRVAFKCDGTFLRMKLPSGRKLAYPFPRLKTTKFGDLAVVFMDNASGKWTECRYGQGAYGGTWIENCVQSCARDLFAAVMPKLEAAGYPIVLHVHDEIVCEVPDGFGAVEEFHKIMVTPPAWAAGLPIAAKVRNGPRFAKIDESKHAGTSLHVEPVEELPDEPAPAPREATKFSYGSDEATDDHDGQLDADDGGGGRAHHHHDQDDPGHGTDPDLTASDDDDNPGADLDLARDTDPDRDDPGADPGDPGDRSPPPPKEEKPADENGCEDFGNFEQDSYNRGETPKGSPSKTYIYRDAQSRPYMKVVRTTAHTFPTYHRKNNTWIKGWPEKVIPYRLPELLAAPADEPTWICEGEKDTDNLAALGFIATTNPGGAKQWQPELAQYFKGKQLAYVLEDNDDAGRTHTAKIVAALRDIISNIVVISFPELDEGDDVSDWLDQGGNKQLLLARAEQARKRNSNRSYVLVRASDIVPRPMDWLWEGHILRGSQELLTGIPGGGKSQIHCAFAAYATTGGLWPDGCNGVPAGNVIMLTAEDCLDQTLVPRLIAAGADRNRVHILKKIRKDNKERMFLLNEDLEELERAIRNTGDVRLITIDPITAYMGSGRNFDSHRATDVRGQLGPLADLAERLDVALSAITHPPKHSTQRAIDHFIGSQAFIAAARIGHMAIEEIDEDEHGNRVPTGRSLFTNPKNNVSRKMPTLAYRVVPVQVDDIPISKIVWEEIVDITADQAVAAAAPLKSKDRQGVVVFLLDMLANGPVPKKTIEERAGAHEFSGEQLKYAKKKMGAVAFKEKGKFEGGWLWALPQDVPADAETIT